MGIRPSLGTLILFLAIVIDLVFVAIGKISSLTGGILFGIGIGALIQGVRDA